jgi:hypothetical protein
MTENVAQELISLSELRLSLFFTNFLLQHAPLQVILHALHYLILDLHMSFTISVTRYLKLVTIISS